MRSKSYTLWHVPDHLKAREMCNEAKCNNSAPFFLLPDRFKTEEMCNQDVEVDPWQLDDVPEHFKTQEMCDDAVWGDPFSLQFIPNWFVSQQQLKVCHDNDDQYDDDEIIECYKGHRRRKAQKAKTKE